MLIATVGIEDIRAAERVIRAHVSPVPPIRSYALERGLGHPLRDEMAVRPARFAD